MRSFETTVYDHGSDIELSRLRQTIVGARSVARSDALRVWGGAVPGDVLDAIDAYVGGALSVTVGDGRWVEIYEDVLSCGRNTL